MVVNFKKTCIKKLLVLAKVEVQRNFQILRAATSVLFKRISLLIKYLQNLTYFHKIVQFVHSMKTRVSLFVQVFISTHRSSHRRYSVKKDVFWNLANFTGKHLCWSLFLIKLQVFRSASLLKKDTDVSCEIWESFKNIYFEKHLQTTASRHTKMISESIRQETGNQATTSK